MVGYDIRIELNEAVDNREPITVDYVGNTGWE